MKKKTIIQMVVGILFLLTLIISSTYAYFNIVNTSSNNTTSNYNAKLEDIEKYGTSLLTGGEGELHLRVKASDMTPSKIGNKYYATTSDEDYQLRRGNHIVSKATIQKGLSNYEYNCTSKLTITLAGTMVSEDGLQVGDAKIYLRGTNNNIKNEEYDLKTLIDELETNSENKKEYTREIEYLLTSDNEGKVMIDVEFANNSNNQTTSSGKNLNIEITNSELVCGLGNDKVYANTYGNDSYYAYRSTEWKDKIITASFVDYKPSEEELQTKPMYWDLTDTSKSDAGSVIGWLEEREETDTYDLYIGSDKKIYTTALQYVFDTMKNLQEIKFDNLNTSEATSMHEMFSGCTNLATLDLSTFDTSKVTSMSRMFEDCKNLTDLDLSSFDTSKVTLIDLMFYGCSKIEKLDLSTFDTSKVTTMTWLFQGCNKLINLDLSNFDTSNVERMNGMFWACNNLRNLNISNFDTSKVIDMNTMFQGCSNLTKLNLSHFNTTKVGSMESIFNQCRNLINLDISGFDTSSVKDMSYMFAGLDSITSIDQIKGFKELDTSKVTNMSHMFNNSKITDLDLSHFDTSSVKDMSYMFSGCSNLTTLDLSNFNTSSVTDMSWMFYGFNGTTLDLSGFETPLLVNTQYMFSNCTKLKDLKLNKATFDGLTTPNSYSNMFGFLSNVSNKTDYRVPSDIHLTIKKGQEDFINKRLNDAYPNGHNATIDLVD